MHTLCVRFIAITFVGLLSCFGQTTTDFERDCNKLAKLRGKDAVLPSAKFHTRLESPDFKFKKRGRQIKITGTIGLVDIYGWTLPAAACNGNASVALANTATSSRHKRLARKSVAASYSIDGCVLKVSLAVPAKYRGKFVRMSVSYAGNLLLDPLSTSTKLKIGQ